MTTDAVVLTSVFALGAVAQAEALPPSIVPLHPGMRLAAPAFPVKAAPGDNLWLHRAIQAALPGEVLVADTAGGPDFAYWDNGLAEAAASRKLAGIVINGGVCDATRLVDRGWPVFAPRVSDRPVGQNPDEPGDLGEPIVLGGVEVCLGDLIVADVDGIVRVPSAHVEPLRRIAPGIGERTTATAGGCGQRRGQQEVG